MLSLLQGLVIALWRCALALLHVNTGRARRGHVPGRGGGSVPDAAHLKPLSQSTDRCRRSGTCRFLETRKPATFTRIHADARTHTHTCVRAHTHTLAHTQEERERNSNFYICPTTKFERPRVCSLSSLLPSRAWMFPVYSSLRYFVCLCSVSRPCLVSTLRVSKTRHAQVSKP
jgi:hypothetical protein